MHSQRYSGATANKHKFVYSQGYYGGNADNASARIDGSN
jgi:hypothetical protein